VVSGSFIFFLVLLFRVEKDALFPNEKSAIHFAMEPMNAFYWRNQFLTGKGGWPISFYTPIYPTGFLSSNRTTAKKLRVASCQRCPHRGD
jgi:hypothetical protein